MSCSINIESRAVNFEIIFFIFLSVYALLLILLIKKIIIFTWFCEQNEMILKLKILSYILFFSTGCKVYLGRFLSLLFWKLKNFSHALTMLSSIFSDLSSASIYVGVYFSWIFASTYLKLNSEFSISKKTFYARLFWGICAIIVIIYEVAKFEDLSLINPDIQLIGIFTYKIIAVYSLTFYSYCILRKIIKSQYSDDYSLRILTSTKRAFVYFSLFYITVTLIELVVLLNYCIDFYNSDIPAIMFYVLFEIFPVIIYYGWTGKIKKLRHSRTNTIALIFSSIASKSILEDSSILLESDEGRLDDLLVNSSV